MIWSSKVEKPLKAKGILMFLEGSQIASWDLPVRPLMALGPLIGAIRCPDGAQGAAKGPIGALRYPEGTQRSAKGSHLEVTFRSKVDLFRYLDPSGLRRPPERPRSTKNDANLSLVPLLCRRFLDRSTSLI